jgi:hypothetical protein
MAKATQRQIVATLTPVSQAGHSTGPSFGQARYFSTVSGGEISASVEKVYDGGSTFPQVLCAPAEIGDITMTMFYDPDVDGDRLNQLRQLVGQVYYDVNVFTLDCDLQVPGTERVYSKSLLVGLTEPDGDASSGTPAQFSLTFSVSTVA